MQFIKKHWIWIVAALVVLAIVWYMRRNSKASADAPWYNKPGLQVGTTKSGKKYTEQDIKDVANYINSDSTWLNVIKQDLKGMSIEEAVRSNAIYTLDQLK